MPKKFADILKDPAVDEERLREVAKVFGDTYVRAAYRDIRSRGAEYTAQIVLGDELDEAERGGPTRTTHEVVSPKSNFYVSASRNR